MSVGLVTLLLALGFGLWMIGFGPDLARAADGPAGFRVVTHHDNPVASVSRAFLSDAFLKKTSRWQSGAPISVVDQRLDAAVRQRFSESVLRRPVAAIRSYWQQLIFSGQGLPPPELESDEAVIRFVQTHRGGIGYVSEHAATTSVRVLGIE